MENKTDMTFTGLWKIFQRNYTIKYTGLHELAVTVNIYITFIFNYPNIYG